MYRKVIGFILVFSLLCMPSEVVDAQDKTICLLGETVYSQTFDNLSSIEAEYFKSDRFSVVKSDDGGNVLNVNALSVADITTGEIGPQMTGDYAVTADLKQLGCSAAGSAYFALGLANTIDQSGVYNGYRFAYSDTIRFASDTPYKIGGLSGTVQYRDALSISRAHNTNRMDSLYYGAYDRGVGVLDNSKRTFDDFYQMRAVIAGDVLVNSMYDKSGNMLKRVMASREQVNRRLSDGIYIDAPTGGKLILNSHSTNMLVDNVKIRKVISATDISVSLSKYTALLGEKLTLKVNATVDGKQQMLDAETLNYVYDDQKLCVDAKNGFVKPIAFGEHDLTIKADDLTGNGSIEYTIKVKCNKGYDVSVSNPSLDVGGCTYFSVYEMTASGSKELKSGYSVECSDGISVETVSQKITGIAEGLNHISVIVGDFKIDCPVSVCDKSVYMYANSIESSAYEFDDSTVPFSFAFSNSSLVHTMTDDGRSVLSIPGIQAHGTSSLFGNSYTQYKVSADFKYLTCSSNIDDAFGIGVRANSSGHYQVSYSPACCINTTTGIIDWSASGERMKDRLIISYTPANSGQSANMLRKQTLLAYTPNETGALGSDGKFDKYYRLEVTVTESDITGKLIDITDGSVLSSVSAKLDNNMITGGGQTLINAANASVYVDRLEIEPLLKVNRLKLEVAKSNAEIHEAVNVISILEGTSDASVSLEDLELIYDPDDVFVNKQGSTIAAKWQGSKYVTAVYRNSQDDEKYATVRLSQVHKTATAFQYTDIHFYDEFDKKLEYMPYAGNVKAVVSVKNQLSYDSDIIFIAVVYDQYGGMVSLGYTKAFVKSGEVVTDAVIVPVNEVNDSAHVEVFAIDSFDSLVPMFSKITLKPMKTRVNWR